MRIDFLDARTLTKQKDNRITSKRKWLFGERQYSFIRDGQVHDFVNSDKLIQYNGKLYKGSCCLDKKDLLGKTIIILSNKHKIIVDEKFLKNDSICVNCDVRFFTEDKLSQKEWVVFK